MEEKKVREPKFKVGDVVKLKSDIQKMTVEQIIDEDDFNGYYKCVWIDNGQQIANFLEDTLESTI